MTLASTATKRRPALDEGAFQQLLAAAYVLQQHNDAVRSKEQNSHSSELLAEIAAIQAQVRNSDLDNSAAAGLIADRLRKLISASGVSISLISDGFLDCVAESGTPANLPGSSVASHSLIATERLKNGEMFESAEAPNDIRLDVALCREQNVASLLAVPIHKFGEIAGLIEARWDRPKGFDESAKRACGLMAGLATGTLERRAQREKAPSISPIFPELAATGDVPPSRWPESVNTNALKEGRKKKVPDASVQAEFCRVCGSAFAAEEAFCGQCSMPRVAAPPSDGLQSKWASLWYMQKAQDARKQHSSRPPSERAASITLPPLGVTQTTHTRVEQPPKPVKLPVEQPPKPVIKQSEDLHVARAVIRQPEVEQAPEPVITPPAVEQPPKPVIKEPAAERTAKSVIKEPEVERTVKRVIEEPEVVRHDPAPKAVVPAKVEAAPPPQPRYSPRESVRPAQSAFRIGGALASEVTVKPEPVREIPAEDKIGPVRSGRRDISLIAGSIVVVLILAVWAFSSSSAPGQLTWFENLMVKIGVAEVPGNAPTYAGRADARVWEDVHTTLYYCEGSNLYGKTPEGRFTSQHSAQHDHFDPATGTVCP